MCLIFFYFLAAIYVSDRPIQKTHWNVIFFVMNQYSMETAILYI